MDIKVDSSKSALFCTHLMLRYLDVSVDISDLAKKHGIDLNSISELEIRRLAKFANVKATSKKVSTKSITNELLPCLALINGTEYCIILKVTESGVVIQKYGEQSPSLIETSEFNEIFDERCLFFKRKLSLNNLKKKFDISWFIPSLLKYKGILGKVLLASFFIQLLALASPLFFQVVIDKVLVHQSLNTLNVLGIGLLAVFTFEIVLSGLRTYLFSHTTSRVDVELGSKLYRHLVKLPINFFENRQVGNIVARVKELDTIRNFITGSALTLTIDLLFSVVFLVIMYAYSTTLFTIVALILPMYVVLGAVITPMLKRRVDDQFSYGAANQAFLTESINGSETVKSLALEPKMVNQWEDKLSHFVVSSFKTNNLNNIANQIAGYLNKITILLILWVGATLVIDGRLSVGQLIAFNMFAGRISGPILRLVQLWQDFQQARVSVERIGDILNAPTEPDNTTQSSRAINYKGDIKFSDISFRYQADLPLVLDNINLSVNSGEVVGIVGRSGSGKSSLAKLIQKLHLPERGSITIDGVDLTLLDPQYLRQRIGVVLQENFLFNQSVRDNIAIAQPTISMDRIVEVAKLAGAHEFITSLPNGYDSMVGEYGRNLSGGQRQRLAIARALVTNPDILIFDEATSALDYESEKIIQDNLANICKGRTVIMIAHRLSTLRNANRIFVIDEGRVIETGNHTELLKKEGYYSRLYGYQNL